MLFGSSSLFEFRGPWSVPVEIGASIILLPLILIDFGGTPQSLVYDIMFVAILLGSIFLHELGHAFGLWGHSSVPTDVLAISQGERPVLVPSQRDRLTLAWVMQQTTRFGSTLRKPIEPAESESLE